jgi:putative redox protein
VSDDPVAGAVAKAVARYQDEPERAQIRYRVETDLVEGLRCEVRTRRHTLVVDEPTSIGGTGTAPNPFEVVLAGLASCLAITYRVWAGLQGVALARVAVEAEGSVDLRSFFGLDDEPRPGFGAIELRVSLEGPEPPERLRALADAVNRACPMLDTVGAGVPVTRTLVEPAAVS